LTQDGIEPTPEAVQKLDYQITELAEFLLDWRTFKERESEGVKPNLAAKTQ